MRTIRFKKFFNLSLNPHKGFTLIELLVVISIISLLSTIAMASLNDARRKARNTQVQQEVGEWLKAIELYKDDNGGIFPFILGSGYIGYDGFLCLGGVHSYCQNGNSGEFSTPQKNQIFKTQLSKYINTSQNPNRKPVDDKVAVYSINWEWNENDGSSGEYTIYVYWYLEGSDWNCAHSGKKQSLPNSNNGYCYLVLYSGY